MFSSITIANKLLDLAEERRITLTPMQVLKLVYIAHGWMLALYRRPLISDRVEAWQYGPVIPALYNAVRDFRGAPVRGPLRGRQEELGARESNLLEQVMDRYGELSGPALSRLTHADGTPWDAMYDGSFGVPIPDDLIEDHYASLARAGD